jgi:hypothetical protein
MCNHPRRLLSCRKFLIQARPTCTLPGAKPDGAWLNPRALSHILAGLMTVVLPPCYRSELSSGLLRAKHR